MVKVGNTGFPRHFDFSSLSSKETRARAMKAQGRKEGKAEMDKAL
jgi:hypothetical protein